jgi:hypothetical protein
MKESGLQLRMTGTAVRSYLLTLAVAMQLLQELICKKIAIQSWLVSYNRGLIGWTTYRRLDAPIFNLPAITGNEVQKIYLSRCEQTLNG